MTTQTKLPPSRLAPGEELFANSRPARRPQSPATPQPTPLPQTCDEAEQRFYRRYGPALVAVLLGAEVPQPETIDEWYALAEAVRDVLRAKQAEVAARAEAVGKVTRK